MFRTIEACFFLPMRPIDTRASQSRRTEGMLEASLEHEPPDAKLLEGACRAVPSGSSGRHLCITVAGDVVCAYFQGAHGRSRSGRCCQYRGCSWWSQLRTPPRVTACMVSHASIWRHQPVPFKRVRGPRRSGRSVRGVPLVPAHPSGRPQEPPKTGTRRECLRPVLSTARRPPPARSVEWSALSAHHVSNLN